MIAIWDFRGAHELFCTQCTAMLSYSVHVRLKSASASGRVSGDASKATRSMSDPWVQRRPRKREELELGGKARTGPSSGKRSGSVSVQPCRTVSGSAFAAARG